jgi:sarcosine oxidase
VTTSARAAADVLVVGLGAMGSSAAYHLAARGARVVGVDRYAPPHTHGSTHGRTRIIREAYYEHPVYVPLVQRAYMNWASLERESECTLFRKTGGLMVGPPEGVLVAGARRSAREHGLAHEELSATEIRRRFPGFAPADDMVGLLEPRAGVLFPELCVEANLSCARRRGAELHTGERVITWRAEADGVVVTTDRTTYRAGRLILSAGPWIGTLVPELHLSLEIERQLFHWFDPAAHREWFDADRSPIAIWEYDTDRLVATFPDVGHGVKIGVHHEGELVDPDGPRRPVAPDETQAVRALLRRLLPDAAGRLLATATCLYTNTPDHHFLIDVHPDHPQVILASPCSGHGFKFSSAIGEILADLALTGATDFDLSPFRLRPRTADDANERG